MDESMVVRLWRQAGLPEYFLGNGGTNVHLCEFARLIEVAEREACKEIAGEFGMRSGIGDDGVSAADSIEQAIAMRSKTP